MPPQQARSGSTSHTTFPVPNINTKTTKVSSTSVKSTSGKDKQKQKVQAKEKVTRPEVKGRGQEGKVTFFVGDGGSGVFLDAGIMERRRWLFGMSVPGEAGAVAR